MQILKNFYWPVQYMIIMMFLLLSCKEHQVLTEPVRINALENQRVDFTFSNLLQLEGSVLLDVNDLSGIDRFRGASKIIFKDDKAIVFDNESDFQNIWTFDAASGKRLARMTFTEDINKLGDMALTKQGNLLGLISGKRAFGILDADGTVSSAVPNGVIGDGLATLSNGEYLVYNEYSATDISGLYQLLFFDSEGNLLKRLYPYSKMLDNYSTRLSGFITSGYENQCWFSPPYCDTIYAIDGHDIAPKYIFDFAGKSVPLNVKLKKNSGWDLEHYAYLTESFVKLKDCFLITYYDNQRLHHLLYDEQNGHTFRFNDASDDYLKELVKSAAVFYKNDDTFALYVNAARVNYLLENKVIDMNALEKNYPELYSCLSNLNYSSNKNPLLIYFSLNKAFAH